MRHIKQAFVVGAALMIFAMSAFADERPEKIWWLDESELNEMSEFVSSFTEVGFTEIPDVKKMLYEDFVLLGVRMCLRRGEYRESMGSAHVEDADVSRAIKRRTGIDMLDHMSVRSRGWKLVHDRTWYVAPLPDDAPVCRAEVKAAYRDRGMLLLTGEIIAPEGVSGDFYAYARKGEDGGLALISLTRAEKPEVEE